MVSYSEYPLVRYRRKILFSIEDLLGMNHNGFFFFNSDDFNEEFHLGTTVSVGGTAGLFTGFCVLGAFDIAYFFTLRLFWYFHGRR